MEQFDPSAFLADDQPAVAGTSQAEAPAEFNPDEFLSQGNLEDDLTGEPIPMSFSGLSPETAMNKSVVDTMDRIKMSVGNVAGNVEYLKTKFKDVKTINDADGKPTNEIAVQKDGNWYRVDPQNGEIADPWEKTQEYMRDLADATPIAMGVAAAAATTYFSGGTAAPAAPAVAAGGAAATAGAIASAAGVAGAVGAGVGALRTSLGRAFGTYEATPAEQAWDIGFEALLNAGGQAIGMGAKPTASFVADKLPFMAKAYKGLVNAPGEAFKTLASTWSVGRNNFEIAMENPTMVKGVMKSLDAMSNKGQVLGSTYRKDYQELALTQQVQKMAQISEKVQPALSEWFGSQRNKILSQVPANFAANFDEPIIASYRDALSKGIAAVELGKGKSLVGKEAIEWLDEHGLKGFSSYAMKQSTAKGTTGLPGQVGDIVMSKTGSSIPKFRILSQAEMKANIRGGAELSNDLGYLSTNGEAHSTLVEFYSKISGFGRSTNRTGVKAAEDLMNFKRVSTDLAYDLAHKDHVAQMPGVKKILDNARVAIDNSTRTGLEKAKPGLGGQFDKMNAGYHGYKQAFLPLLKAHSKAVKSNDDVMPYAPLLTSFLGKPKPGVQTGQVIDDFIGAMKDAGLHDTAADVAKDKLGIQALEAAKAFNPLKSGDLKAQATQQNIGLASYGLQKGDIGLVSVMTGMALLRSPTMAKGALNLATSGGAKSVVQSLSAGQQMLLKGVQGGVNKLAENPQALQSLVTGITAAPIIYERTRQANEQQIQGALQGQ